MKGEFSLHRVSGRSRDLVTYFESSALTAGLLERDPGAMSSIRRSKRRFTSALTICEVTRAILRAANSKRIDGLQRQNAVRALGRFIKKCHLIEISQNVLLRAGQKFPVETVRTLDAIHLASLEALEEAPELIVVVTRDHRVRDNAIALGYQVE